ncbi:MAG: zeta toxin family protein [Magnetococcales bacterium]|nr:zeta toxin family protein [Magnetococcales bacterium]
MHEARRILILAGPNGAGKTSFANEFLPHEARCLHFVNADLIASGLSPYAPEQAAIQAGRLMVRQMQRLARRQVSFAFETTLSGRGYAARIPEWQDQGYLVTLFFLSLPDVDMAIRRVRQRVGMGGHDVPEATIRRRFAMGLHHFHTLYRPLVNE